MPLGLVVSPLVLAAAAALDSRAAGNASARTGDHLTQVMERCCYHHPCRLAQRSKTAEMVAMTATTNARWGKSVRSLTMMFIP